MGLNSQNRGLGCVGTQFSKDYTGGYAISVGVSVCREGHSAQSRILNDVVPL